MKQTKKKEENKECFCGELDILLELENSEIEVDGVKHSIYGCYCAKQTIEKCLQCNKKLPKAYVQMDFKKFCSMKCMEKYYDKWEMMIHKIKSVEARVSILENKPCKIEINKSKKRKINPTKGIDEELKCSHCGNKVIECMGKCDTTLFKVKEAKEKKVSLWLKLKNIINILP